MREQEQRKSFQEQPVFGEPPPKKRKKHPPFSIQQDALPIFPYAYRPTYTDVFELAKFLCEHEPGLHVANAMQQAADDLGYEFPPKQTEE
jgi:hypothetical protein